MKTIMTILLWIAVISPSWSYSSKDNYVAYSQAPYFHTNQEEINLPLMQTNTSVHIDNNIADILVEQKYQNNSDQPIEAIYTFPASTRAAVYSLKITIEDRVIQAVVQEKQQAKDTYERAKSEGKSAALLEQDQPNIFTMNVANILPGEQIKVELRYTEYLKLLENTYEFVSPAVSLNDNDDFNLYITSGTPLSNINSPSHDISILQINANKVEISLSSDAIPKSTRDFILQFTPASEAIQTGLLLQKGEELKENYFAIQIQPPNRIKQELGINREYLFVIDTSGSMKGFPLSVSKSLVKELVLQLNPWEKFNIVFFAGNSTLLSSTFLNADKENIDKALSLLTNLESGGGTDLITALKTAATIPADEGYIRSIITITDGYVSVDAETYTFINNNLQEFNHFSFGTGNHVDRHIVELIARAGFGQHFISFSEQEARKQGKALLDMIRYPVLTDIDIKFNEFDVYDVQPIFIPDLFANKPITITGKWRGLAQGSIEINARQAGQTWKKNIPIESPVFTSSNALEYIWARQEIQQLQDLYYLDKNDSLRAQITTLGLDFNLLTEFTSFVAIDTLTRTNFSSKESHRQAIGYALPHLTVSLGSLISSLKSKANTKTLRLNGFLLEEIEGDWIDRNHSADIPIYSVSMNSDFFIELKKKFVWLNDLSVLETYYINLGKVSIRFSPNDSYLENKEKSIITLTLSNYEKIN